MAAITHKICVVLVFLLLWTSSEAHARPCKPWRRNLNSWSPSGLRYEASKDNSRHNERDILLSSDVVAAGITGIPRALRRLANRQLTDTATGWEPLHSNIPASKQLGATAQATHIFQLPMLVNLVVMWCCSFSVTSTLLLKTSPALGYNTKPTVIDLAHFCTGEVAAGLLLSKAGGWYLLVVGEAPKDSLHTSTMIYDLREGTWTSGTSRPLVGHHHASEVINNELYLFGGLAAGESATQIASLEETSTGVTVSWSLGPELPIPSGSASTALIDDKARLSLHRVPYTSS